MAGFFFSKSSGVVGRAKQWNRSIVSPGSGSRNATAIAEGLVT